jgi:hypothetical protein
MNSIERFFATVSHQEPDRVPIGEWGVDCDHVSRIIGRHTYWRNRRDTALALWAGRRDEVVESKKQDYSELIEKLDYDVIPVHLVPPRGYRHPDPPKAAGDDVWKDSSGKIYKYAASNHSIMCVTHPPAKEDITEDEIAAAIENIPDFDSGEFELVDHICQKFGKTRAVVFRDIYLDDLALPLFGGDASHRLMMPVLNPEAVERAMRYALIYAEKVIRECAKRDITVIMHGRDYGNTTGCIESPQTIRYLYLPFHKQMTGKIEQAGCIPFLHCCGSVRDLMDDFVAAGYKGYQSIQASAGMNWDWLKTNYGQKMTLWTGVQCETLINGTRLQVEHEVRKGLEVLMPRGGFIFGSTNSVQYGASTDNYLYALDLVRKYGNYR